MRVWQTVCGLIWHLGETGTSITIARIVPFFRVRSCQLDRRPPASTAGIARRVMALCLRPNALYALSSVSGCRIRAPRIRHQGRHKGRPSALRSMRLCMGRSGGAGARAWPPSPRPARLAGFSSRHKNCAQPVASERTADTIGHYPVTVNPPTPSACGQYSGALR